MFFLWDRNYPPADCFCKTAQEISGWACLRSGSLAHSWSASPGVALCVLVTPAALPMLNTAPWTSMGSSYSFEKDSLPSWTEVRLDNPSPLAKQRGVDTRVSPALGDTPLAGGRPESLLAQLWGLAEGFPPQSRPFRLAGGELHHWEHAGEGRGGGQRLVFPPQRRGSHISCPTVHFTPEKQQRYREVALRFVVSAVPLGTGEQIKAINDSIWTESPWSKMRGKPAL